MDHSIAFVNRDDVYYVVGVIDFDTSPAWLLASQSLFKAHVNETITLNLAELSPATNSSALALMIEWLKLAKRHQVTLKLAALPDTLSSIAKISGVLSLIHHCL